MTAEGSSGRWEREECVEGERSSTTHGYSEEGYVDGVFGVICVRSVVRAGERADGSVGELGLGERRGARRLPLSSFNMLRQTVPLG